MKARLVKFEDDGTVCKNDINYLRRHPECGIPFIQDKPFTPHNPSHKFRPHDRDFSIDILDRAIPRAPDIPPPAPMGKPPKIGGAVGPGVYTNQFLPQDYTNYNQSGRRLIGEHLEYNRRGGYARLPTANAEIELSYPVPKIGNNSYSHETPAKPTRPVGDIELTDFGAGKGKINTEPPAIRQSRIRPIGDPRDTEFTEQVRPRGMTDEELIDFQIEQLTRNSTQEEAKLIETQIKQQQRRMTLPKRKVPVSDIEGTELVAIEPPKEEALIIREAQRFVRKGRPTISQREAEQIATEFLKKGISRDRTFEILEQNNLYDVKFEAELQKVADPNERAMLRRMRAMRIIEEVKQLQQAKGIQQPKDTNLLPKGSKESGFVEIELRETTPLTRARTDIPRDRVAGKLPEELRGLASKAKVSLQNVTENIRTGSFEAMQKIRTTSTRVFGQKYSGIRQEAFTTQGREIELTSTDINIRRPATEDITGIRVNDLQQTVGRDPLGRTYEPMGPKPKLTYAQQLRKGAFSKDAAVTSAGAVGGVLIGFGVAELMGKAGVDNQYAIAATAGGAGGAGARILTMAGSRALTRGAISAGTQTASSIAIRTGTSLLRGAAEGAVVGLALMPLDMALNNALVNAGASHALANVASGGIIGTSATAATAIGLASLGAAPATLGLSLAVGAAATAVSSIIGLFTGAEADRKEREAIEEANKIRTKLNETNYWRNQLLMQMENYDWNYDRALQDFTHKDKLGMDDETWSSFDTLVRGMFNPRPSNSPPQTPTSGEPATGEQKKINDLFSKHITHMLIFRSCGFSSSADGCKELKARDPGALTDEETKFLDDKTGGTWEAQALMQQEMSFQELNYTRKRIGDAQTEMINAWKNDGKIPNQLDPYIVQTASLDPTFRQRYDLAIKLDAQQQVVDAYQTNQTRFEQLPKNVRDMANLDPDFDNMIHQYYKSVETTAGQLDISVPQLIELQNLEGEAQKEKYQEFQFDNIKADPLVVADAKELAEQEDAVREAGFYDLDQAFLETDPTAISTWHPTDSQILQAHSAGMNLNEYVQYMHQLAKGEAGDYSKLPKYSEEQLRASGLLDYSHFQDELQLAGYRKDLYLYNPETREFTLNPNVTNSAIPSTQQSFISRYTPRYLLQARQEYADMIHGLNQANQQQVDSYNANLMRELSSYGKHYDSMVAAINDERLYEGRTDLLYFDVGKIFNENKIEFNAFSDKLKDAPTNIVSKDEATSRQLSEEARMERKQAAAEKYGISVEQYTDVKKDLQSKGIKDATQEQITQSVQEVKQSANTESAVETPSA